MREKLTAVIKKAFGGLNITWPKLIVWAVIAGVYTAVMAIIPALRYSSFITITTTFEVWILFGILIIMNSRSNLESGLKCFVFFLISQPLVYLVQVPFSRLGWDLFSYYKTWFIWTLFCFPMGFIGYYMKKNRWWGYLILFPMIALTGYSLMAYFGDMQFYFPRYLLIVLFCAAGMILYPVFIFDDRRIKIAGAVIGAVLVAAVTVICIIRPLVYDTYFFSSSEEHYFDGGYSVSLEDERIGDVKIEYVESIDDYMVHGVFRRHGRTKMTLTSPTGEEEIYDLAVEKDTYSVGRAGEAGDPLP